MIDENVDVSEKRYGPPLWAILLMNHPSFRQSQLVVSVRHVAPRNKDGQLGEILWMVAKSESPVDRW